MPTIKSVVSKHLKKEGSDYDLTAYLYRTGILLIAKERYKGTKVTVEYWQEMDIAFSVQNYSYSDDTETGDVGRVVLSNASILALALPDKLSFFPHNNSDNDRKSNVDNRLCTIHFPNGAQIRFNEQKTPVNYSYHNSDICIQGSGYWSSAYSSTMPETYTPGYEAIILGAA